MGRRKLIQYLLLNIFVSASVTGTILFWYDRNSRAANQPSVQQAAPVSGSDSSSTPIAELQTDVPIKISSVVGAGTFTSEIVVIKFEGAGQLDLASWQLKMKTAIHSPSTHALSKRSGGSYPQAQYSHYLYWGIGVLLEF